jgi:hypothetical protein
MAVQVQGDKSLNAKQETSSGVLLARPIWPTIGSNGAYHLSATTGIIAVGIAANGIIGAFRWTHATKLALIRRIRVNATTITAPTTAQSWGVNAVVGRSYSASHTGGTALTLTGNEFKKRTSHASTQAGDIRIATTAALGGGTVTADAIPFMSKLMWELVGAATVQRNNLDVEREFTAAGEFPLVLAQNEGILIRNSVLTGATMTYTAVVEIEWLEVDQLDS